MTKRNKIYLGLCVFAAIDLYIDEFLSKAVRMNPPFGMIIGVVGISALTMWWMFADAQERSGRFPGRVNNIMTVAAAPLGLAIYLYRNRSGKQAVLAWLGYWAGFYLAALIGAMLKMAMN